MLFQKKMRMLFQKNENAILKLYHLQFITIGISTLLNEHFQQVKFHFKPPNFS